MLLVVLYHAELPIPGGFSGVDVFFVISGFVITRVLYKELRDTGRLRLGVFYARRTRRLLPALTMVLLAVALGSVFFQNPLGGQQATSNTGLGAAVFVANAVLFVTSGGYFDIAAESNPLLHTWTLAVEEQFYVIFPLILILGWAIARIRPTGRPLRALMLLVTASLALSLGLSIWLTYAAGMPFHDLSINRRFAFFGSPTRAWEFAFGALIALGEAWLIQRVTPRSAAMAGIGGAALLLVSVVLLSDQQPFPGFLAIGPVAATSLLLIAGTVPGTGITRLLTARWLTWVGDRSYGWYLWHWPAIVFTRAVIPDASALRLLAAAVGSLGIAWLSYKYVEQPIRRNRRIVGHRALGLAAVCVLTCCLALGALRSYTRHPGDQMAALVTQYQAHYDSARDCQSNLPDGNGASLICTWPAESSRGTVLLLGDSNAGHFAEPVSVAANDLGYDFTLATFGGCPVADVEIRYKTAYNTAGCRDFINSWDAAVLKTRPSLVVLASASAAYMTSDSVSLANPQLDTVAATEPAKEKAYEGGLTRQIARWAKVDVPTLIVNQVPQFSAFDLSGCPSVRIWTDAASCGREISLKAAVDQLDTSKRAEKAAAAAVPGTGTLDLVPRICEGEVCATSRHGEYLYRDAAHLSVPYSLTLTSAFSEQMARLL